jgi:hypothetical protein
MYSPLVIGPPQAQPKPLRDDLLLNLSPSRLPGLVFTGASGRYQRESDAVLRSVGTDGVRSEHWIDGGRTLLLEGQRTNLLTYSEQFDNAAWTKARSTITANAATAPDGTSTADLVSNTAPGSLGYHYVHQAISLTENVTYTVSFFAKRVAGSGIIWLLGNGSGDIFCYFNLNTGTVAQSTGFDRASITEFGNGFYRCTATFTNTAVTGSQEVGLGVCEVVGTPNFDDTGKAGQEQVYVWGGMLEQAPTPSSYIPTAGASVGRNAESAYVPWHHAPQSGWWYARIIEQGTIHGTANERIWQIGASGGRARIEVSGGKYTFAVDAGGAAVAAAKAVASPTVGDSVELLCTLDAATGTVTIQQAIDEIAEAAVSHTATGSVPAAWAQSRLYINSESTTSRHGFTALRNLMAGRGPAPSLDALRARAA